MRNITLTIVFIFLVSISSYAQLPPNSYAPNFTLTDIEGNEYTLYDYLDSGKSVIVDFSATWCNPCWQYHNGHTLKDIYENYGPDGTDEMMVFFIEGDLSTTSADLRGDGGNTWGDWITGTPYPIIDLTSANSGVKNDYQVGYFPTVYLICPDRIVTEIKTIPAAQAYAKAQACPELSQEADNARLFDVKDPTWTYCSDNVTPKVVVQNYGTDTLTSLEIVTKIDGNVDNVYTYNGSIPRLELETITLPATSSYSDGEHTSEIVLRKPNDNTDVDSTNNNATTEFTLFENGMTIQVVIITDDYYNETSWEIKENSTTIVSQDQLIDGNNNKYVCLEEKCYTFYLYDSYGDGMESGGVYIRQNGSLLGKINSSDFNSTETSVEFCVGSSDISEQQSITAFNIYPNPVINDIATVELFTKESQTAEISIYNQRGQLCHVENTTLTTGLNQIQLNTQNFVNGVYFISINTENAVVTDKILIHK